jgi:hypothetical protein
MPYTSHGHPYGWVNFNAPRDAAMPKRCGGPRICKTCKAEANPAPAEPTTEQAEVARLKKRVAELEEDAQFLEALSAAGVDNWDGYDYAQEIFSEWQAKQEPADTPEADR